MQLGVSSSLLVVAMPPLPETKVSAHNNDAFGITVSGIELDNGATITAKNNVLNGILLEDSTLKMSHMAQFPGSTLKLQNNGVAGVSVAKASVFDVGGQRFVTSTGNSVGIGVDDGSTATIRNSEVVGNDQDLVLTFAARADLEGNTIGSISCDETVLIRGDEHCPDDDEDGEDEDD